MKSRHDYLYLVAFFLAAALRFIALGAMPLNDTEATWALQALSIAQGEKVILGGQPGYITLSSLPFYIFQSSNFTARFIPALAGSLIVFLPYFIRENFGNKISVVLTSPFPDKNEIYDSIYSLFDGYKTTVFKKLHALSEETHQYRSSFYLKNSGNTTAIIAAFLLAIAPGLVAVSRQAKGTMLAVTFGAFAWAMWKNKHSKWAGIFTGIALLGGTSVWMGLLGITLTWALAQNLLPRKDVHLTKASPNHVRSKRSSTGAKFRQEDVKIAVIFMSGTILLVGTRLFLSPNGLSAWFSSFIEYLRGWRFASGVPALRILGGLIAYYPLALFFGIIAGVRGIFKKDTFSIALSLWATIALTLALLYPARQVSDLIWTALPLWMLSATEINRYLRKPIFDRNETLGVFALTFILLVFSWLNLASASVLSGNTQITTTHQILLAGSIALLILSLALIAMGWSAEVATLGGAWGIILGLGIYTLGAAWGSTGLRTPNGVEIWENAPRVSQTGLLLQTIEEISTWSRGDAQTLAITVNGINSPALEWALRNYTVNKVTSLDITTSPELVLTPQQEELALASAYRGQDFVWRKIPDWLIADGWAKWIVLRELPEQPERIILWARNDLFFDNQNQ